MTDPDPDAAARRALARQRGIATALLGLMAALTLGSAAMPAGTATELLQASAKAGLVGGLADWFAVVALFRRPLGLPIPHTAVIPAQKERLGRALGRFLASHVFTEAELSRTLARIDIPGLASRVLADPGTARPAARALAALLPRLLAAGSGQRLGRLTARLLPRLLGGPEAGRVVARALRGLMAGGQHQDVLSFLLTALREQLATREGQMRGLVEERVREQGGRLIGWAIGASVAGRVLSVVNAELDKIGPDGSELRAAFDAWASREIERMETDPARAAEIGRAIRAALSQDVVQSWLADVGERLRGAVQADAARENGHAATLIESALAGLSGLLASDPAVRAGLQRATEGVVRGVLPTAQAQLSGFIGDVVAGWDTDTLVDRLELRVGHDLQYIRMNGTLVGFLAGGVVYAVLRATFGHVGP